MAELQPYRVYKNKLILDSFKFSGQAIDYAKEHDADEVYYLNSRNFGTTVWDRDWHTPGGVTPSSEGYM